MSRESLAAKLDALDGQGAFVSEAEDTLTVSGLDVPTAQEVLKLTEKVTWPARIFDDADNEWAADTLKEELQPFRIELQKPQGADGVLRLLTNTGFAAWLKREDTRSHWEVARLSTTINTQGVTFTPWDAATPASGSEEMQVPQRSPRTLVREFSNQREVPASLDRWLLRSDVDVPLNDVSVLVWANAATYQLLLVLPDEFEADSRTLRFRGPPRLDLMMPDPQEDAIGTIQEAGWSALQRAVRWVFEIEREAEMRHILLATELARSSGRGDIALNFIGTNLADAHEAARTAYQVQLAGVSGEALKALAELRRSVTDETARVADATRQIVTAVAGALAVGVGLIAARLTNTTSPLVISLIMALAGAYVLITLVSGMLFTRLQRDVRAEWQPRIYRFLSEADYSSLVGRPIQKAEHALRIASLIGVAALVLMMIITAILLWDYWSPDPSTTVPQPGGEVGAVGSVVPGVGTDR